MNVKRFLFAGASIVAAVLIAGAGIAGCSARDPGALTDALARRDLAGVQAAVHAAHPHVRLIGTDELASLLHDSHRMLLLDARTSREFDVSHIPGAVLASVADVPEGTSDLTIVVYCSVGVRSSVLVEKLMLAGHRDVRQLDGSIFRWAIESRPMVDSRGHRVTVVHPYSARWAKLLPPNLVHGSGSQSPDVHRNPRSPDGL